MSSADPRSRIRPCRRVAHESQPHELSGSLESRRPFVHQRAIRCAAECLSISPILGRIVVVLTASGFVDRALMEVGEKLEMKERARYRRHDLWRDPMRTPVPRLLVPTDERDFC